MYDAEKAAHVLAYLVLKTRECRLGVVKAMKLLYLADREMLRRHAIPIMDEPRVSMPMGPVNSCTYDLVKNAPSRSEPEFNAVIARGEDQSITVRDGMTAGELLELSRAEMRVLDHIWEEFGQMTGNDLIDWTHDPANVPEWKDPNGSSKPIAIEQLLKAVGRSGTREQAGLLRSLYTPAPRHASA